MWTYSEPSGSASRWSARNRHRPDALSSTSASVWRDGRIGSGVGQRPVVEMLLPERARPPAQADGPGCDAAPSEKRKGRREVAHQAGNEDPDDADAGEGDIGCGHVGVIHLEPLSLE